MSLHVQQATAAPQPLFARHHVYPVRQHCMRLMHELHSAVVATSGACANGQNMCLHAHLMVVLAVFLCNFHMTLLHFALTGVILPI